MPVGSSKDADQKVVKDTARRCLLPSTHEPSAHEPSILDPQFSSASAAKRAGAAQANRSLP